MTITFGMNQCSCCDQRGAMLTWYSYNETETGAVDFLLQVPTSAIVPGTPSIAALSTVDC